jgi:hypothetical protein
MTSNNSPARTNAPDAGRRATDPDLVRTLARSRGADDLRLGTDRRP